jgi:hypothetical protein
MCSSSWEVHVTPKAASCQAVAVDASDSLRSSHHTYVEGAHAALATAALSHRVLLLLLPLLLPLLTVSAGCA